MFRGLILTVLLAFPLLSNAQEDIYDPSAQYEYPKDPLVRKKLDQWQDLKFGVILHWGVYTAAGIPESWVISGEPWPKRDTTMAYEDYKKWYWGLASKLNPVKFNPDKWAEISKNAGMKYIVFTTKHHDGFNMFDTRQSDYKITNGPFAKNPKADVTKYIFDAYRKQGMMIGAYFSKPDWHSQDFWWDRFPTPSRNINYDMSKYPQKWQKFKDFTYNQIAEILGNYGQVDILWLDGGWVRPALKAELAREEWGMNKRGRANYPNFNQEVDMPRIAKMAREKQPGILVVDRTVHGPYENYRTPEQSVPKTQMKEPWETCITLTKSWSYRSEEKAKSGTWVIHTLAEIVAKGGNMLLGFGPTPEGEFPKEVEKPLEEVGQWLKQNGEAIYGTRITDNYNDGTTWFTQSKDGKIKYAIVCVKEGESLPATLKWKGNIPAGGSKIRLISTGKNVNWKQEGEEVVIVLPKNLMGKKTQALAFAFN
ncbi:alpha-L-fucosidase [Pedobacter heparinus]|uniref:alpha-L-fucosidase n=1 Tax=Pedobacter heparinus (strain ATCC 13125 / DSM 2366 / CIP 104194 / JCM 7457 / NBRC 12017 / NCIMB 9290 / NRRL B-14731 / HIM 762-3) TaxID=485917 RepID=C6Y1P9_PEDHD|nr:alpha-L-fucosidase [Pedobacter heparinus]ACU05041.1 Alpha-L-fucosidase [Pedobacter heparinus DSM 2366]